MKKAILILSLICIWQIGNTQTVEPEKYHRVNLYNSFILTTAYNEYKIGSNHQGYDERNLTYLFPSISFEWKNKKNRKYEVELRRISFTNKRTEAYIKDTINNQNRYFSGQISKNIEFNLRFSRIFNCFRSSNNKLLIQIAGALNPTFLANRTIPKLSSQFEMHKSQFELFGTVMPNLTYAINERFTLKFGLPIHLAKFEYLRSRNFDPSISSNEQIKNETDFTFFPKLYEFRLGFGVKI